MKYLLCYNDTATVTEFLVRIHTTEGIENPALLVCGCIAELIGRSVLSNRVNTRSLALHERGNSTFFNVRDIYAKSNMSQYTIKQ